MAEKIAVVGGGAWGSALACVSTRASHSVALWCRSSAQVEEIRSGQTNTRYLDGLKLDPDIAPTDSLENAVREADLVLFAVPAQSLASVLDRFPDMKKGTVLVTTCKGIDRKTGRLPSGMVQNRFPGLPVAALSGPSFATDVVKGLPTAVSVASGDIRVADQVSVALSTPDFRCYSNDDLHGVELGGALKNVLALAVGAARGMELGASAEAALIARGFAEITRLATALGANPSTLMGLSGLGDITLTCSTPQSRNFTYGVALGKGDSLEGLKLAEGAHTAAVALRLALENTVDVPITSAVVDVLDKRITAREAVQQLLTRPLKRET